MKVEKIIGAEKTVRFNKEWEGEPFSFSAKERALTPSVLQAFSNIKENPIELANGLAEILGSDWDVYLEKEGDYPPTSENLAKLPVEFLNFILETISETWNGGKSKPAKSPSSSAPLEK